MLGWLGPGKCSVVGGADHQRGRGHIGGNLWHCCARMCEAFDLLFGVVSRVGLKRGVLDVDSNHP